MVVIAQEDEDCIERAVGAVVAQECTDSFEVIVVVSGEDRTADIVRSAFPDVTLVQLSGRALPGEARNAGLGIARGDYVTFPGSHVELTPGSLASRIHAHDHGHVMVTGAVRNGTPTWAGWAAYFLDHSDCLPDRPSGELTIAPPHCSYVRRLAWVDANVEQWGGALRARYRRVLPLVVLGVVSAWAGIWFELLRKIRV